MSDGTGRALNAGVRTNSNVPLGTEDAKAVKAAAIAEADRIVEASQAKVALQELHLIGAKAALKQAVSDRKGLN